MLRGTKSHLSRVNISITNRGIKTVTRTSSYFGNEVVLFSLFNVATLFGVYGGNLELPLPGQHGLLELYMEERQTKQTRVCLCVNTRGQKVMNDTYRTK